MSVRLLTYNIREGGVGRAERIAEVITAASPDIVALQEARDPGVIERIATLAGFPYCGARPAHSTGFLSRVPVLAHEWRHPPRTRHALLEVSFGDGLPRLFVLHLRAWFSKWSEQVLKDWANRTVYASKDLEPATSTAAATPAATSP